MTTKASLHQLIDTLPDTELEAAERYLLFLREMADPVRRALLTAPWDDEPETEEERSNCLVCQGGFVVCYAPRTS